MNRILISLLLFTCVVSAQERRRAQLQPRVSVGYTPASDASKTNWIKSYDLSLSDNDPVTTWTAAHGPHAEQSTAGNKPLFKTSIQNSKPIIRFDGTDDYMTIVPPASPLEQPFWISVAFKIRSTGFSVLWDGNGGSQHYYLECISGALKFYAGTSEQTVAATADTSFHILTIVANGASSKFQLDGGVVTTFPSSPGANVYLGFVLGAFTDFSLPSELDLGELICGSGALSDADITARNTYLNSLWAAY